MLGAPCLVELRGVLGALKGQADLQQQVQPRVCDVALRVPESPAGAGKSIALGLGIRLRSSTLQLSDTSTEPVCCIANHRRSRGLARQGVLQGLSRRMSSKVAACQHSVNLMGERAPDDGVDDELELAG